MMEKKFDRLEMLETAFLVADHVDAMLAYWDKDCLCLFANHAYKNWFGKDREEILGAHISELLGLELYSKNLPFIKKVLEGHIQVFERDIPLPNGEIKHSLATYTPHFVSGEVKGFFVLVADSTPLKKTEKELSRLTEEYRIVFEGTQDAIFLIKVLENGEFRFIRNNLAHQQKTGILLEQIANKTPQELLGKELGDIVEKNYQKCVVAMKSISYEEQLSLPAGVRIWLTTLTPVLEEGTIAYIVGSSSDITERKNLEMKLEKYANYDKLTDLPNRRLFFEKLEHLIKEKRDKRFALLFVDLDGFKEINDEYGHEVGDNVLITVGNRLLHCVKKNDTVARIGGDEFTVIIEDVEDKASINKIVERIHKTLQQPMIIGQIECSINSSIGVAIYPDNGKNSDTLLKHADLFMYEIKKNGKGGYKI